MRAKPSGTGVHAGDTGGDIYECTCLSAAGREVVPTSFPPRSLGEDLLNMVWIYDKHRMPQRSLTI